MSAFLSIHDAKTFRADTVWAKENGCSPHITLHIQGETFEDRTGITVYLGDAVLCASLIEAINGTVAAHKAGLAAAAKRSELIDAFHAGDMGDVEFTEEALALNFSLEEISELLAEVRDEEAA